MADEKINIKNKEEIRERLKEFKLLAKDNYIYELIFCLLTPQSNARKCWQAVQKLKECKSPHTNLSKLQKCLKTKTRFYKNKSKYIIETYKNWPETAKNLDEITNIVELRNWLSENILGLGMKESSHFLRNIGKSNNQIAILDRHILRNLQRLGIIKEIPKTLAKKTYLEIEEKMKEFAENSGIDLDELDLYFWSRETGEVFK